MYTKEWFIHFFEKIDEKEIGKGSLYKKCALWHCGICRNDMTLYVPTEMSTALIKLFGGEKEDDYSYVYEINDGYDNYPGKTPKERILNKLKSL